MVVVGLGYIVSKIANWVELEQKREEERREEVRRGEWYDIGWWG